MTPRKITFLLAFAIVPGAFWAAGVNPALSRRHAAITERNNAHMIQQSNRDKISRRDELATEWLDFKPLAKDGLQNLGEYLNPILIQKRVYQLAASFDCKLRISQQGKDGEDQESLRFNISGEGHYKNLVELIDTLERGSYRIRFEELSLILPSGEKSGQVRVTMNARFTIPRIPSDFMKFDATDAKDYAGGEMPGREG